MKPRITSFATAASRLTAKSVGCTLAVAAILGALSGLPAGAETIRVAIDQAKVQRLVAPATTIIVGNPLIADVSVQENDLLVVTGKAFGTTNLIVLDDAGGQVADFGVVVHKGGTGNVTLYRGTGRMSYNCAPRCERTLEVGDTAADFDATKKAISDKAKLSRSGNGGSGIEAPQ